MKILLWIESDKSIFFQKAGMILKGMYGECFIESFVANDNIKSVVMAGKKLQYIAKDSVKNEDYDIILVVGSNVDKYKVLRECQKYDVAESKVVFDFEVCIPGFTIEKSNKLHRLKTSIFSINSFGKSLSKRFGLPYLSPFVDSVMPTEDWLSFLEAPQKNLFAPMVYQEKITDTDGTEFPVFSMGEKGPKVFMLYETDVEKSKREWAERVRRINWLDILLVMYTDSPEVLDRFDCLPYAKKVCFTSFESNLDSAFYLPDEQDTDGRKLSLWESVEKLVESEKPFYDLWDMLLYGRRAHITYVQ